MKKIGILLVAFLSSACTVQHQLTRAEWLELGTRHYSAKSPEDVFAAAEKVFRLADGDDFQIAHTDNAIIGYRRYVQYFVLAVEMGSYHFHLKAEPAADGTKAVVQISNSASAMGGVATGAGGAAPLTVPGNVRQVVGSASYRLFWARMDYFLGKKQPWLTCDDATEFVSKKGDWSGVPEALCTKAKDILPERERP